MQQMGQRTFKLKRESFKKNAIYSHKHFPDNNSKTPVLEQSGEKYFASPPTHRVHLQSLQSSLPPFKILMAFQEQSL